LLITPNDPHARGLSERQRDKALALIGRHLGGDIETAVTSSKIKKKETSS
jgi:hypothetical protein